MLHRLIAAVLVVIGLALLAFGIGGMIRASRMTMFLTTVAESQGSRIDPKDWAAHWRVASAGMASTGVGITAAAIGVWRNRAWGSFVVAGTCVFILLSDFVAVGTGYSKYAFERSGLGENLAVSAVAILAMIAGIRRRRVEASSVG
jgi:hypothetical protein